MEEDRPFHRLASAMQDGYGDFCLVPVSVYNYNSDARASSLWMPGEIRRSVPSKTDEREFRFLELPKDIRDIVYSYLIEPFRDNDDGGSINIDLRPLEKVALIRDPMISKPHPFRNRYNISVRYTPSLKPTWPSKKSPEPVHVSRQPSPIWVLSQVCHQTRQEIGEAFWTNVNVTTWGNGDLLIEFLEDRPAVHAGITSISTTWDCFESVDELDDKVIPFCDYVAKHLALDVLYLTLLTSVELARDLVASEGRITWVHAFRKMNFKRLILGLGLTGEDRLAPGSTIDSDIGNDEVSENDSDDSYGPIHPKLEKKLVPAIKALLDPPKPEIEAEPLSDQQAYLQARAATLEASIAMLDV